MQDSIRQTDADDLRKYSPRDLEKKIGTRDDKYNICEEIHLSVGEEAIKAKILQYHAVLLGRYSLS